MLPFGKDTRHHHFKCKHPIYPTPRYLIPDTLSTETGMGAGFWGTLYAAGSLG